MPHEMKKRAVLERLREKYIHAVRTPHLRHAERITLELAARDISAIRGLTHGEFGEILLEIERDYGRRITATPLGGGSRREAYRVEVDATAFPQELLAEKYSVKKHDNYWCILLPGGTKVHRVGRIGSLKGELFAELSSRLGKTINLEEVVAIVAPRVRDPRTENPTMEEVEDARREINRTLNEILKQRLHLIPSAGHTVQVVLRKMEHYLWNFISYYGRGGKRVGIVRGENPPRRWRSQ